jgi:hypothetical protein
MTGTLLTVDGHGHAQLDVVLRSVRPKRASGPLLRDRAGSRTVGQRIETDKGAVQQEDRGHAAIGEALETDCIAGQTRASVGHEHLRIAGRGEG